MENIPRDDGGVVKIYILGRDQDASFAMRRRVHEAMVEEGRSFMLLPEIRTSNVNGLWKLAMGPRTVEIDEEFVASWS